MNDDDTRTTEHEGARGTGDDAAGAVMDLLAEHVPLTLLADLAAAEPRSEAILQAEGLPEDAWWEGDDARPAPSAAAPSADPTSADPTSADLTSAGSGAAEDEVPGDEDAAAGPTGPPSA